MTSCSCGFIPTGDETLTDHFGEMFIADDDADEASHLHAEASPGVCLCGHTVTSPTALDAHLLAAFTPPDHLGRDGRGHDPVEEVPGCATVRA